MLVNSIIILGWILCGILTYGIDLAYFQYEHPLIAKETYKFDVFFVGLMSLCGPCGLVVAVIQSGLKYGYLYRKPVAMHNRVDELEREILDGQRPEIDYIRMEKIIGHEFGIGPHGKPYTKVI